MDILKERYIYIFASHHQQHCQSRPLQCRRRPSPKRQSQYAERCVLKDYKDDDEDKVVEDDEDD